MTHLARRTVLVVFAVTAASISLAGGKDRACDRCGGDRGAVRICRPVTTVKYVPVTCWDYTTQDFCIPRKCRNGCCEGGCNQGAKGGAEKKGDSDGCKTCDDCTHGYQAVPKSRNRLLKKTCVTRVPCTTWVVEYVCHKCEVRETKAGEPSLMESLNPLSPEAMTGHTPGDETLGDEPPMPRRLEVDPFADDPSANKRLADQDPVQMPPAPVVPAPPR